MSRRPAGSNGARPSSRFRSSRARFALLLVGLLLPLAQTAHALDIYYARAIGQEYSTDDPSSEVPPADTVPKGEAPAVDLPELGNGAWEERTRGEMGVWSKVLIGVVLVAAVAALGNGNGGRAQVNVAPGGAPEPDPADAPPVPETGGAPPGDDDGGTGREAEGNDAPPGDAGDNQASPPGGDAAANPTPPPSADNEADPSASPDAGPEDPGAGGAADDDKPPGLDGQDGFEIDVGEDRVRLEVGEERIEVGRRGDDVDLEVGRADDRDDDNGRGDDDD